MKMLKQVLQKTHHNLETLREREAKYGGNVPLELLNQIADHAQAIELTDQALAGELSEAEWQEAMKPLLVAIHDRAATSEICQVTLGDIGGDVVSSIIAGRDVVVIYNYPPPPAPVTSEPETAPSAQAIPANPYRGLFAFRPEHAPFFFGRETFTQTLMQAVESRRLVAVLGASGSGKSSVVFAGLVPALLNRPGDPWLFTTFRPGDDPFHNLASALLPLYETDLTSKTAQLGASRDLATSLLEGRYPLADVFKLIRQARPDHRLLLIADQFEELYTLSPEATLRQQFLKVLLAALDAPETGHLVLTLRADFLGQALLYRPLADALQNTDLKLGPMTQAELAEAIEKPAARQGVVFEKNLIKRLLDDVGEEEGSLPLLEFALTELWQHQQRHSLTHVAYDEIDEVKGALSRHADKAYRRLTPTEQAEAHRVFVQLVNPGAGTEDTRRLATRTELEQDWALVAKLASERLVVTNQVKQQQDTVEVVHEALIRHWQQLRLWMAEDRTFRAWQERLRFAMAQWQTSREEEALLRGSQLAEARGWLTERPADLSQGEKTYIEASLAQQYRQERNGRLLLAGAVVAAVVMTLLAVFSLFQWQDANRLRTSAEAERDKAAKAEAEAIDQKAAAEQNEAVAKATLRDLLSINAYNLVEQNPQMALLLALESQNITKTQVAADALARAPYFYPPLEAILQGHAKPVLSVAWNPAGTQLASASSDHTIMIWDAASRQRLATLTGHKDWVWKVAWSPDGNQVASASDDVTLKIWDVTGQTPRVTLKEANLPAQSLAWRPDGKQLAAGYREGQLLIWDLTSSPPTTVTLAGHTAAIYSVAWSPDGTRLASASKDKTVIVWNLTVSPPFSITLAAHNGPVRSVAWRPDGLQLASAAEDRTIIIWDMSPRQRMWVLLQGHTDIVFDVAWSRDGTRLASASFDKTVIIWDAVSRRPERYLRDHSDIVWSVAWRPDGAKLASASTDKTIMMWDVEPRQNTTLREHTASVLSAAWSPDGAKLASASVDQTVIIRSADFKQRPRILEGHKDWVLDLSWSPDSSQLASASFDRSVIIWNALTGKVFARLDDHPDKLWSVAWSPDGSFIAAGAADNTLTIWDAISTQVIERFKDNGTGRLLSLAWSSDSRFLATGADDGTIIVRKAGDWSRVISLKHPGNIFSLAWSPDGKNLASGSSESTTIIWETARWSQVASLPGHSGKILDLAWNKEGTLLASAAGGDEADNKIIVWDIAKKLTLVTLKGHTQWIWSVGWSPDGSLFTSASDDATIQVLKTKYLQPPCAWLSRNLTYDEWQQYLSAVFPQYHRTCPELPSHFSVIETVQNLAKAGKIEEAMSYFKSLMLDASIALDPAVGANWNALCWYGSLWQQEEKVKDACQQAVALAGDDRLADYLYSRGVNRALLKDYGGAIEDLQAYVAFYRNVPDFAEAITKRQKWIEALKVGQNPFDETTLKSLREE
jgi:WD40 repeat protein